MALFWLKMDAKMSKRLRNYPDPTIVIQQYGADAVRLYMMHSPAVKAEDLCFLRKWCRACFTASAYSFMECL